MGRSGEDTSHLMIHLSVALSALFHVGQVFVHFLFLFWSGELLHQFTLGSQHHEGDAEDGVGAGGEDGECDVAVFHVKLHFRSFRASNPVALCLFE